MPEAFFTTYSNFFFLSLPTLIFAQAPFIDQFCCLGTFEEISLNQKPFQPQYGVPTEKPFVLV